MRFFKKSFMLFLFITVLLFPLAVVHVNAEAGEERTIYLSATEYDYPPFSVTDSGEADGFSVDLLKAVAEEMGIIVTFKVDQWSVIKEELENGELDILPLVGYTEERDEVFDFTAPYIVMRGNIFVRKGETSIQSQDDLFGKEILVLDGDNSQEWAWSIGLDSELTATTTYLEAFELLASGEYDAVLAQGLVGEKLISDHNLDNIEPVYVFEDDGITRHKLNLEGYEQKFCFAVVEGDTELLSILNEGLLIVSANGTYDELYDKWFPFLLENEGVSTAEVLKYVGYTLIPILALLITAYFIITKRTIRIRTQEINDQKEQSEKYLHDLILSGNIFKTSIENAPIPIMIHAEDGQVINISQTWTKLTGYKREDIPTIYDWTEKAYSSKKEDVQKFIQRLHTLTETQHDGEFTVTTKDGNTLIWDFYSTNLGILPDGRAAVMSVALDVTKRNHTYKLLQESEQRFKALHNASFSGIVIHDQGVILDCNQGLSDITGYSIKELKTKDLLSLISPEDRKLVMEKINTSDERPYEIFGITKNNERYPLRLEGKNVPYEGKMVRVVEFKDLTEIKKSESEAQYRDQLLGYVIKNSNQGIAVHDKNLNYVYVSDEYCNMYHVDKNIIGKHHYDVFPDLPQKWRKVHQRVLNGDTLSADRDLYVREDGTEYYTRWVCKPWYSSTGDINGIIIYTEVINDIIKTENQLRETLERLQLVMDNLTIGIAVNSVNPSVEFEYMNSNFPEFYETTKEALMKPDAFWDEVYEDESFRKEIKEKVLKGLASNDPKLKRWENVPITKNGEIVRYITAQGVNIPNTPLIISMVMDVTEQKRKEEEIIYSSNHDHYTGLPNRKYFQEQLNEFDKKEYLPITISTFDVNGLIIINEAFGYEQGNEFLLMVTETLKDVFQHNSFISRVGGDEFAVILVNTSEDETNKLAREVANRVKAFDIQGIRLSIAYGVAIKTKEEDIKTLFNLAENAMHSNKIFESQSFRNQSIQAMINAYHEKNPREEEHSNRVSELCEKFGIALGMSHEEINKLKTISHLHDIGKIAIDEAILNKQEKLTNEEWGIIKKHPEIGARIISSSEQYGLIAEDILSHHERWDGKGYPRGLIGKNIPLRARMIAIVDSYDAMTSYRTYRKALTQQEAIDEIIRCSDTQFDPELVDMFVKKVITNDNVN